MANVDVVDGLSNGKVGTSHHIDPSRTVINIRKQFDTLVTANGPSGDHCAAEYYNSNDIFILLVAVHITKNTPMLQIITFLHQHARSYTDSAVKVLEHFIPEKERCNQIPMTVSSDFNYNFQDETPTPVISFLREILYLKNLVRCT